jgi:hypothetical protein
MRKRETEHLFSDESSLPSQKRLREYYSQKIAGVPEQDIDPIDYWTREIPVWRREVRYFRELR